MLDRGSESRSSFPPRQTRSTLSVDCVDKNWTLGTQKAPDVHQKRKIGIRAQIEPIFGSLHTYYKTIQENINFCKIWPIFRIFLEFISPETRQCWARIYAQCKRSSRPVIAGPVIAVAQWNSNWTIAAAKGVFKVWIFRKIGWILVKSIFSCKEH